RLSKSLGVLHVLNADRIEKLLEVLKTRMHEIYYNIVSPEFSKQKIDLNSIKSIIQNHKTFDVGTKEVGIDFVNFLQKRNISNSAELKKATIDFFNHKKQILGNIEANEVFLADYYGVLENTLLQIENPQ